MAYRLEGDLPEVCNCDVLEGHDAIQGSFRAEA
jgi:hypothetical protein